MSLLPKTDDQRDAWYQHAAAELLSRSDDFARWIEVSTDEYQPAALAEFRQVVSLAYHAGRLNPMPLVGVEPETVYFSPLLVGVKGAKPLREPEEAS